MAKYKIPRHPVIRDFGIVKILGSTYICPGWIPVDEGTTRDDVEFSDDIIIENSKDVPEVKRLKTKDIREVIKSSNGKSEYIVSFQRGVWGCTCPAATFRRGKCKHIKEVETKHNLDI